MSVKRGRKKALPPIEFPSGEFRIGRDKFQWMPEYRTEDGNWRSMGYYSSIGRVFLALLRAPLRTSDITSMQDMIPKLIEIESGLIEALESKELLGLKPDGTYNASEAIGIDSGVKALVAAGKRADRRLPTAVPDDVPVKLARPVRRNRRKKRK